MGADFPLFEWNEEGQRLEAMHHPFTAPNPEDMHGSNGASLKTARALAYDLVYNGVEIAGRDVPARALPAFLVSTHTLSRISCRSLPIQHLIRSKASPSRLPVLSLASVAA